MAHIISNTDKIYPCVSCGSKSANIIREGSSLQETRVKCNACSFMYSAADSKELEEKGGIPDGPPVIQKPVQPASRKRRDASEEVGLSSTLSDKGVDHEPGSGQKVIPRTPSFVFLSSNRSMVEFCTKRALKKTVLAWEHKGEKYDVFELAPKIVSAKIEVQ